MADERIPLEEYRKVAVEAVVAIAPFIADYLKVLEAANLLKASVARYLTIERGMSKRVAAASLGLTERWVYRHLARWAEYLEAPTPLRKEVLQFFEDRCSEPASAAECISDLEARGFHLEIDELLDLLDAYVEKGFLVSQGSTYQWAGQAVTSGAEDELATRTQRVREWLRPMIRVTQQYMVEGTGAFVRFKTHSITQRAYEQFQEDMRQALVRSLERAHACSRGTDPLSQGDNIDLEGVLTWGPASPPSG